MSQRFTNWAGTARAEVESFAQPSSEDELRAVLREANAQGKRVKVVGGAHSWSDAACPRELWLNLDRLDRLLAIDRARGLVTVEAGMRLGALNQHLAREGMALAVLGSIVAQSVAGGAISTGTHGSAPGLGNLASLVESMRLVLADGSARELSAASDPELFAAARVGLGALGVIAQVTLRCVPSFRLEETTTQLSFDEALRELPRLVANEPYVKLWWMPHTDVVQVFRCRSTESASTFSPFLRWFDERVINRWVFAALLAFSRFFPGLIPAINGLVRRAYFKPSRRVARSDLALTIAMPPVHQETEYSLPIEQAAGALRELRGLIESQKLRVNFIAELRFVAGDDAWLSPAFGRQSCFLGAYMAKSQDLARYFESFERKMISLGGRPHWGKQFSATAGELRALCPNLTRFDELRRRLDPRGIFVNDFIARVFGA